MRNDYNSPTTSNQLELIVNHNLFSEGLQKAIYIEKRPKPK